MFVDGRPVGTAPLTEALSLPPGKHALSVRAADHEDAEREFEVQAGAKQVLDIVLSAKSAPLPAAAAVAPPVTPESGMSLSANSGAPKPKSRALSIAVWTSLAGAVAAGAVAGTFLIIRDSEYSNFQKYNDQYRNSGGADDDQRRRAALSDMDRSKWIAIGCGIGAGALAVTALATYFHHTGTEDGKNKTTVSLSNFGLGATF